MPAYDPALLSAHLAPMISQKTVTLNGREVPRDFNVRLEHPGWPTTMLLSVTVDPERGPIASGLANFRMLSWGDKTTDVPTYRELAAMLADTADVNDILHRMSAEAAAASWHSKKSHELYDQPGYDDMSADEYRSLGKELSDQARRIANEALPHMKPRRRRVVNHGHLEEVAKVYRAALEQGMPPTQHVADSFQTSHSTASRWVFKARKAGALGAATGPRPGEADS